MRSLRMMVVAIMFLFMLSLAAEAQVVITMDRYACLAELYDQSGNPVDLYGLIANEGTEVVNLTCRLDVEQPAQWLSAGVCVGQACFPSEMDFPLALDAGEQAILHLTFYPYTEPGKGSFVFNAAGAAEPVAATIEVLAGSRSLIIDDDEGTDCQRFVEDALPEGVLFLTWNESLEPLSAQDLPLLDRLIWMTGDVDQDALNEGETQVIGSFLDAGGKAILTGENILDGAAAGVLGVEKFGAEVRAPSVESRTIEAVIGGVFDEGFSFEIAGGTGADNQFSPSSLYPVNGGRSILAYDSGEAATVRRALVGGYRAMVCGFGIEAIASSEDLETFLDVALQWLDSTDAQLPARPVAPILLREVMPNPATDYLRITLALDDGAPVTIWLTDLSGRRVAQLHQGPWTERHLMLPPLSAGVYLISAQTTGTRDTQSVILLGD